MAIVNIYACWWRGEGMVLGGGLGWLLFRVLGEVEELEGYVRGVWWLGWFCFWE